MREEAHALQQHLPGFMDTELCTAKVDPPWFTTQPVMVKHLQLYVAQASGGALPSKEACKLVLKTVLLQDGRTSFLLRLDHPCCGDQRNVFQHVRLRCVPADHYQRKVEEAMKVRWVDWVGQARGESGAWKYWRQDSLVIHQLIPFPFLAH